MKICKICKSDKVSEMPTKIAPFVSFRMMNGKVHAYMYECNLCNMLWIDINPSLDDLSRYYSNYWSDEYIEERKRFEPQLLEKHRHLLQPRNMTDRTELFINKFIDSPNQVLDIGGGSGIEAPFRLKSKVDVFEVYDVEMAPGCNRVNNPDKIYDLITMSHVLEHVPDPVSLILDAYSYCNDNGYIYIEIPDEAKLYGEPPRINNVAAMREFWHEHIQFYDTTSITKLIEVTNGKVLGIEQEDWVGGSLIRVIAKSP